MKCRREDLETTDVMPQVESSRDLREAKQHMMLSAKEFPRCCLGAPKRDGELLVLLIRVPRQCLPQPLVFLNFLDSERVLQGSAVIHLGY